MLANSSMYMNPRRGLEAKRVRNGWSALRRTPGKARAISSRTVEADCFLLLRAAGHHAAAQPARMPVETIKL